METPIKKNTATAVLQPLRPLIIIQGGTTPTTLPEALDRLAELQVAMAEGEQLKSDVKDMGRLLAHMMGEMGILELWEKTKGQQMTLGTKMKFAKKLTGGVMDAMNEDSELRKIFDDKEVMESFKRVLAYASTRE